MCCTQFLYPCPLNCQLGPNTSRAMPVIHALTGCDVVSSFGGEGKNPFENPGIFWSCAAGHVLIIQSMKPGKTCSLRVPGH